MEYLELRVGLPELLDHDSVEEQELYIKQRLQQVGFDLKKEIKFDIDVFSADYIYRQKNE